LLTGGWIAVALCLVGGSAVVINDRVLCIAHRSGPCSS
jgi:hypothetical protein